MNGPSTRNLNALPDIATLLKLTQSLAALDAILSPEWDFRYYSFDATWAPDSMMASMRNGSGDDFFIWFGKPGAAIKGFAHEAAMSPYRGGKKSGIFPGLVESLPAEFGYMLTEPAFVSEDMTFLIWRGVLDHEWKTGPLEFPAGADVDGSEDLLRHLDGDPEKYQAFASEYFEFDVELADIQKLFDQVPLTAALVESISSEATTLDEIREDIVEIGYPLG